MPTRCSLRLRPQSVPTLVDAAVEHERERAPKREFRISIAANIPAVLVDAAWIQKVLFNLLGNAVKYSGPHEPIFISAEPQGDMVAISVAERGIGIEALERA